MEKRVQIPQPHLGNLVPEKCSAPANNRLAASAAKASRNRDKADSRAKVNNLARIIRNPASEANARLRKRDSAKARASDRANVDSKIQKARNPESSRVKAGKRRNKVRRASNRVKAGKAKTDNASPVKAAIRKVRARRIHKDNSRSNNPVKVNSRDKASNPASNRAKGKVRDKGNRLPARRRAGAVATVSNAVAINPAKRHRSNAPAPASPNSRASRGSSGAAMKAVAARADQSTASKPARSRAIVLPNGPTDCAMSKR